MRVIFVPGFGEKPSIFDQIHPHIPGEKVFIDNWELVGNAPRPGLTVLQYAREVVEHVGIGREDIVVGHSMGGWIALYIKHLVGCPIIQISSWTNQQKVVSPVRHPGLLYWGVRCGLGFNLAVKWVKIWQYYRNKPSREAFSKGFDQVRKGNQANVLNQLRIIFNPVAEKLQVQPDLRIHARPDSIVRFPDECCCEVSGDHYTLCTHPEQVYEPINNFLMEAGLVSAQAGQYENMGKQTR